MVGIRTIGSEGKGGKCVWSNEGGVQVREECHGQLSGSQAGKPQDGYTSRWLYLWYERGRVTSRDTCNRQTGRLNIEGAGSCRLAGCMR